MSCASAEYMALHRVQKLSLGRILEIGKHDIERVQLVEVAMPSDRRSGPP
jgi:hypothetical protein